MEETYRVDAIILNRYSFRENDSRVIIYSKQRGKMELVARGTSRPKSKLVAHIEPIGIVETMVVKGKRLDYVGSIVSRHAFYNIKNDLDKLTIVGRIFFIFDKMVRAGEIDEKLFELLSDFLKLFEQEEKINMKFLAGVFILKLLAILGYEPDLQHCMNCNCRISPGGNYFDSQRGGLVCGNCYNESKVGRRLVAISDDAIKIMRYGIITNWEDLKKIKISANLTEEFAGIVNVYLAEQS